MKNKYNHKNFVFASRIIMGIILGLNLLNFIIIPSIIFSLEKDETIDSKARMNYDEYKDLSWVYLDVYFDHACENESITVEFFDAYDESLGIYTKDLTDGSQSETLVFRAVPGCVKNYKIYNNNDNYYNYALDTLFSIILYLSVLFLPVVIALFIRTYLLNYKEYYVSGDHVQIYSGWSHHQLVVNNQLLDEEVAFFHISKIILNSTYNNNFFEVMINMSNRIKFKYNNQLVRN